MTDATTSPQTTRTPSQVDAIADRYLDATLPLDPIGATYLGVKGYDDRLTDYSPAGHEARAELTRRTLAELDAAQPQDDVDRVTVAAMRERLGLELELHDGGHWESELNVIASPLQGTRSVFDLMATATADDWSTIARRLAAVPQAVDSWLLSLRAAADRGDVSARRQVEACAKQAEQHGGEAGFFRALAADAAIDEGELPESVRADLARGAAAAAASYTDLARVLREELLPKAPERDACGREEYALWSRYFLGATVDLEETYAWGQEELARIVGEMEETAERIKPGASVAEAIAVLDADEDRKVRGTDALTAWMQQRSDEAVAALAGTHFDIPEPIRRLECRIAPTTDGGIYYTGPSEDFSRPGRMWWAVPEGVTEFGTWRELTTVYHEGVPGHHLQVAQTVYRSELLNRWRRMACWVSGHGEGWALYAERLMADLGFLDDPGDRMGMLDGQVMRAARVVLDIGVHCGFAAPASVGGGAWDYDKAWRFLTAHSSMAEGFLRFELDRYLGWPGQAPSYKVGERLWMQARDEVRRREGDAFDLKAFHRRALDVGSVGLDVLRGALLP